MDEKAAQIIARVVEGKLLLWPQTLAAPPQPMGDQSFILSHAALVKVSALAAEDMGQTGTKISSVERLSACTSGWCQAKPFAACFPHSLMCDVVCLGRSFFTASNNQIGKCDRRD